VEFSFQIVVGVTLGLIIFSFLTGFLRAVVSWLDDREKWRGIIILLLSIAALTLAPAKASAQAFELEGIFLSSHDPGWMKIQPGASEADEVQPLREPECIGNDFNEFLECSDKQHEWWEAARAEKKWIEAQFLYRTIPFETVSEWEMGTKLSITYHDEAGVALVGPDGQHYKVHLPNFDVIQALEAECLKTAGGSSMSIAHCEILTAHRLDLEFERSAEALMATVGEAEQLAIRGFVGTAATTLDALTNAYRSLVENGELVGTRHLYVSVEAVNELRQQYIVSLWAMFD